MFEKNERRFDLKTKVFKQGTYKRYVLGKLSKFDQISTQISSDCCLQRILRKLKQTRKTSSSGQQHVNGHLHIKKMFFPVLRFFHIFSNIFFNLSTLHGNCKNYIVLLWRSLQILLLN